MAEPLPTTTGGTDAEALLRRVHAYHLRSYADHIQIGILLQEESAFQSGMDSQYFGFFVEKVDIRALGNFQQG